MSIHRSSPISVLSILALAAAVQAASPAPAAKSAQTGNVPVTSAAAPAKPAAAAPAASAPTTASKASPAIGKGKGCEAIKAAISAKLVAKGVKVFTLDAVSASEVKDAKVVGTCEGGSKKITYKRG